MPPTPSMPICLALGAGIGVAFGTTFGAITNNVGLGVAMGPGLGASLGLAAYFIIQASQRQPFTCPSCGFSTKGLPTNRCPECGETFDPAKVNSPAPPEDTDL